GSRGDGGEAVEVRAQGRGGAEAAGGAHMLHECGIAHGSIDRRSIFLTGRGGALGPPAIGGHGGVVTRMQDWRDMEVLDPALLRGEEPSRSTDIWALATTLHSLLSPRPLYAGIDDDPAVRAVHPVVFQRPEID